MNLEKCDKCGNRNIMCFLCENNKHYRETKYSHNNSIRNNAIDEFAENLRPLLNTYADRVRLDEVAEYLKGGGNNAESN